MRATLSPPSLTEGLVAIAAGPFGFCWDGTGKFLLFRCRFLFRYSVPVSVSVSVPVPVSVLVKIVVAWIFRLDSDGFRPRPGLLGVRFR